MVLRLTRSMVRRPDGGTADGKKLPEGSERSGEAFVAFETHQKFHAGRGRYPQIPLLPITNRAFVEHVESLRCPDEDLRRGELVSLLRLGAPASVAMPGPAFYPEQSLPELENGTVRRGMPTDQDSAFRLPCRYASVEMDEL